MGFALDFGSKWESCGYLGAFAGHVPHCPVVRHLEPVLQTVGIEEVLGQDHEVGGHEFLKRHVALSVLQDFLIRPFTYMQVYTSMVAFRVVPQLVQAWPHGQL